jgi:hypothetical protein
MRRDPNKAIVYQIDSCFWNYGESRKQFCRILSPKDWTNCANKIYDDALWQPYHTQDRKRRTKSGPLQIEFTGSLQAWALQTKHRLCVASDYTYHWVAIHEVAHLLLRESKETHGPEFISLYTEMIERLVGVEDASVWRTFAHIWGANHNFQFAAQATLVEAVEKADRGVSPEDVGRLKPSLRSIFAIDSPA